jgi:hypothetical protein
MISWWCDLVTLAELARLGVLAEDAPEIAPREEDRAGAVSAAKDVFLAPVPEIRRYAGATPRLADGVPVGEAVDPAATRTERAGVQGLDRLVDRLAQLSALVRRQVGGDEVPANADESTIAGDLVRHARPAWPDDRRVASEGHHVSRPRV